MTRRRVGTKLGRGAALAGLLALLLAACSREPIRVGVPLVLTGLSSRIGVTGRNGIELAAEEINARGGIRGRPLELLVRDDRDDPAEARALDEELLAQGALALVGHMSSRSGLEAIPFCNENSLPLLSPTISSSDWSGRDDYFFRPIGANELQGEALAADALAAGHRRAALLYEESNRAYTLAVAGSFSRAFEAGGGEALEPRAFAGGPGLDPGALAAELAAAGVDLVLSAAGPYDNALLCQGLARLGSPLPVYAGMWSMTDDLSLRGGRSVERMVVAGTMDLESPSPAFQAFRRAYRERYGEEPSFASAFGYEAMVLLGRALEGARRLDGPGIKAALLGLGGQEGVQGPFALDAYGDSQRPYRTFSPVGGAFRPRP